MSKILGKIVLFASLLMLVSTIIQPASADGWHPSQEYLHLYEPAQKSVIYWDGFTEIMYLSSAVKTDNLTNIAWVVPILSNTAPEVSAGNMSIFEELVDFFRPVYYWEYYYLHDGRLIGKGNNVTVLEVKEIDIYDVIIVKATNASDLIDWLIENNLQVPKEAYNVINSYVQKNNCYYVINKLDLKNRFKDIIEQIENGITPENASEYYQVINDLRTGLATPLKFEFTPTTPYYPLTISSLNSGYGKIEVYFIGKNPVIDKNNVLEIDRCKLVTDQLRQKFNDLFNADKADFVTRLFYKGDLEDLTKDAIFELYQMEYSDPTLIYISSDLQNLSGKTKLSIMTWNPLKGISQLQYRIDGQGPWMLAERLEILGSFYYLYENSYSVPDENTDNTFWSIDFDTTDLPDGTHTIELRVMKNSYSQQDYSQVLINEFIVNNSIDNISEESLINQDSMAILLSGLIVICMFAIAIISRKTAMNKK